MFFKKKMNPVINILIFLLIIASISLIIYLFLKRNDKFTLLNFNSKNPIYDTVTVSLNKKIVKKLSEPINLINPNDVSKVQFMIIVENTEIDNSNVLRFYFYVDKLRKIGIFKLYQSRHHSSGCHRADKCDKIMLRFKYFNCAYHRFHGDNKNTNKIDINFAYANLIDGHWDYDQIYKSNFQIKITEKIATYYGEEDRTINISGNIVAEYNNNYYYTNITSVTSSPDNLCNM